MGACFATIAKMASFGKSILGLAGLAGQLELPGILVGEHISCSKEVVAEDEAYDALKLTV